MKHHHLKFDVIVVGAGPVGLFLAGELASAGVQVLILESLDHRVSELKLAPLGVRGLSVATVETFYRRGMLEELQRLERGNSTLKDSTQPRAKRGGHFAGISIDFEKVDQSKWKYKLDGPADSAMASTLANIEQVLEARVKSLGVEIRYGVQVTHISEGKEEITAYSTREAFTGNWLVGCDGGRSTIRKLGAFEFVGTEPEFTAYTGLVNLTDSEKINSGRNLTPTGFYMQPTPGYISMMEFDGGAFDRSKSIDRHDFEAVLRRVSGTDVSVAELKIATSYTDRAKAVTTYQKGRILLAGDAARIHSPLGGQGLNVGLGDALNLGWKLAAVVKQQMPKELLHSYFTERFPIAEWVLAWTRAQVQLLKPDAHSRSLRKILTDLIDTPDGATYFADQLWSATLRYPLGTDHAMIGISVPDFLLTDGSRVGSHFDCGKGLLLTTTENQACSKIESLYPSQLKMLEVLPSKLLEHESLLVRPDGVVCWSGSVAKNQIGLLTALSRWFSPKARV